VGVGVLVGVEVGVEVGVAVGWGKQQFKTDGDWAQLDWNSGLEQ
jgi:hypothetical protein